MSYSRKAMPVTVPVVLTLLALILPALMILAEPQAKSPQQDLPKEEEALYKFATEKYSNYEQWPVAERAFKKYAEDFPQGKNLELVLFNMATIKMNRGVQKEARQYYQQIIEKFPKGTYASQAQYQIASSYYNENKPKRAEEEFRKLLKAYPGSPYSGHAIQMILNATNKNLYMYVSQSYTEGEEISLNCNAHNIKSLKFRLYRVAPEGIVEKIKSSTSFPDVASLIGSAPAESKKLVKEWEEKPKRNRQGYYENVAVKPEIKEAGLYTLSAEPDAMDIAMSVNLIVAKYGLIVKSARDQVLAFAIDRRNGTPIQDMGVTYTWGPSKIEGKTDANGLCVFTLPAEAQPKDGVYNTNGAVFGIKDSEVALANTYAYNYPDEEKIYITTDRPVYRPNQMVHFKAVVRELKNSELKFQANEKWLVEIKDPKNNTVYKSELATNEFGTLNGQLMLGDEPALGFYQVSITDPDSQSQTPNRRSFRRWYGYNQNQGQFRVEEYRKPEYKVNATFDGGPYSFDDKISASIDVQYYFGSPVVDADVQYTVYRQTFFDYDWGWDDPWYWYYADEPYLMSRKCCWIGPWYYNYSEPVTQGSGRTNKDGKLKISFTASPFTQEYHRRLNAKFVVQAKVVDKSRREVEGSGSVKVTRADFNLMMSFNKYVYKPGETVDVKARAVDIDGKPVKDVRVTFKAFMRDWRTDKYHDSEFFTGKDTTDANGVADMTFTAGKDGYVYLIAEAVDNRERPVKAENTLWISGHDYYSSFQNMNGLDIVPDKNSYAPGDTARLLVTSQFKGIHALVTLEGDRVLHREVVFIKGHSKLVEIKLDKKEYSPNVTVSVTTLIKNQYLTQNKVLIVPPDAFLTVKVSSDKATYRPREEAKYTVETLDKNGKPVSAEVSIGVVDDSIYAIQDELAKDIRKFFYAMRPNRVHTVTSLHYSDWGRGVEEKAADAGAPKPAAPSKEAPAMGRMAQDAKGLAKQKNDGESYASTEVRSYFPDTMFWTAQVVTDKNGRAEFKAAVPDSLTTWRTTARAITAATHVGSTTQNVIARKNVIMRLETPRFFTQNDETVISAVVHNYLENVTEVKVELESDGIEVIGEKSLKLSIPKGEDKRVDWKVKVTDAGVAKLAAKALTAIESDAMKLEIPILAHGSPRYDVQAGVVENKLNTKISVPGSAIKQASELKIVVSPTVANTVLDALDYLAGYPYGCVEQTMSRFLPTVVAAQALQKLGIENKKLQDETPAMIAAGLQRLYNFQQGDGGWGWWQNDRSNPYTTAYVVYGLTQARAADADVDANVIERGAQALLNLLQQEKDRNTRAYMLYALTFAKLAPKDAVQRLYDSRDRLSDYSRGLLAYCLHANGMIQEAKIVIGELEESAKVTATSCYWEGKSHGYGWMDQNVEATAYILKAMVAVNPKSSHLHKVVRWLVSQRQGDHWNSTKDTAAIVYALSDYLAVSDELNAGYDLKVMLNGEPLVKERIDKKNMFTFNGVRTFKWFEFNQGDNEISIEKNGNGIVYYSIYLKTYTKEEDFKATGSIQIERTYNRVEWDRNQKVLTPIKDGEKVTSGEEIEVVLKVTSDQNHQYVLIEDPLPSGFEVEKDDQMYGRPGRGYHYEGWWNWWYTRKEARDNRVCIASTYVPKGTQEIHYTMRAETPGDFHVMPTRAYNMYHPEIGGTSAENRIKVVDKK